MCASAVRYSESAPGSGNVAKKSDHSRKYGHFRPTAEQGPSGSRALGGRQRIHHRAEDSEHGRRDAQDGGLPRPRGGRWVRRPRIRPRRRFRTGTRPGAGAGPPAARAVAPVPRNTSASKGRRGTSRPPARAPRTGVPFRFAARGIATPGADRARGIHHTRTRQPGEERTGDHAQGRVGTRALPDHHASPRTYNEARTIGEHFREGTPVIMNLTEMDDTDAKRLVDFAAGLVFGLHGSIER